MVWGTSERPLWREWQFGYALTLEVVTAGSRLSLTSALRPWKPPPHCPPRSTEEGSGGLSLVPHPENCLVFILLLPEVRSLELLWAQLPCALSTQKRKFHSSSPRAKSSLVVCSRFRSVYLGGVFLQLWLLLSSPIPPPFLLVLLFSSF